MDITKNQLEKAVESLGGNLNKFSILKNSCATVALGAWNAAVGTRDGQDTAYKLTSSGDGILSIIDAPKGVRQSMVNRLHGTSLSGKFCIPGEQGLSLNPVKISGTCGRQLGVS